MIEQNGKIKKSKNIFFEKAPIIHNNYYDYSKVDFRGVTEKVIIICPKHGEFQQISRVHLKGHGCDQCGIEITKQKKIEQSKNDFFEEAPKIHNNYYDYSKVDFRGVTEKVIIICPKHGEFQQTPHKHKNGKQGCSLCGSERTANGQRKTLNKFISESTEIHGIEHYNYDLVEYINDTTNIKILCNIHKKYFIQTPSSHLQGRGCTDCGSTKRSKQKINTASLKFWEIVNKDEDYDFKKFIYTKAKEKSSIICKKCNNEFQSSPNNYLSGKRCPVCVHKTEQKIYNELKKWYPSIIREFKVEWCKNILFLPFDFVIEERKIIIELDGNQHFKKIPHFKNFPEENQKTDKYKMKCANENNFSVIRILQEDVLYDKYDWFKELQTNIEKITNENTVQNIYMYKNDEYKDFI